ncbi:ROK family protein [Nonomuraea aurantiaca]|uniref:ROK family protein n=1 Tax=Nonomuraea aurantiaca TaxID=2878562 RepID=UPI001CD9F6B9|nr:ROK family protein [Nonomuraea aurantiaca]MCA2228381.1 ROK family protein [Nonomuraea aurantiaca]
MVTNGATTSAGLRAYNRVRLLRAVHDCGATRTRSRLTQDLALARGTASVLVSGLADDRLLHEEPAAAHGRGRPTQVPGPHPEGPLALAVDLREDSWEVAACELGGRVSVLDVRRHDGTPEGALRPLGEVLRGQLGRLGSRVIGVGLAVAGPVRDGGLVDVAHLRWRSVDVPALLGLGAAVPGGGPRVGNDTAFAALAEARRGRLRGIGVGLHVHVDFDLGGVLVVDGRPLEGAGGMGAEFGHMPLTGGDAPCMCGAHGCWGMEVGANALLRHMGLAYGGGQGRDDARRILATAEAGAEAGSGARGGTGSGTGGGTGDATGGGQVPSPHDHTGGGAALRAVRTNAQALGRGLAALVNAHDPAVVTLSGLGVDLYDRALPTLMDSFGRGLMTIRHERPPVIAPSALGWQGPLVGAMESVFDMFLTVSGVESWRGGT